MKTFIANIKIEFPLELMLKEGKTEQDCRKMLEILKNELKEEAPEGYVISLTCEIK